MPDSVSIHRSVEEKDLPGIFDYIARDNPDAAGRVIDEIVATFKRISRNPTLGPDYPLTNPRLKGIHMLPVKRFKNYLIFYRIEEVVVVRILYVFHGARNLPVRMTEDLRS